VVEGEAVLGPGDRLLLHSDGVVEGRDPAGSPFGLERLHRLVAGDPGDDLHGLAFQLVAAALAHQGGETRDDATVMLICQGSGSPD
jgi:serine phosphatase RsbU (regulator of sigma subunit)